jgi:hypothetical protein
MTNDNPDPLRLPGADTQRNVCNGPLGQAQGEAEGSGRFLVRIASYRWRLCDPDALVGKHLLDCARYAGIIPDDSPKEIDYKIFQIKCKKGEEKTVMTIERI